MKITRICNSKFIPPVHSETVRLCAGNTALAKTLVKEDLFYLKTLSEFLPITDTRYINALNEIRKKYFHK